MRLFSPLLFVASVVLAVVMHRADAALQAYRDPAAPESGFRLVPIRWFNPALYTPEGERHRLMALRAWRAMILCFLAGMLAFGLGL